MEHENIQVTKGKKGIGISFEEMGTHIIATYVVMESEFITETGTIKKHVIGLDDMLKAKEDIFSMLGNFHNCNVISETV